MSLYNTVNVVQSDIRKNPAFRSQFHEMCAKVGVDPLASNKGFWAELLGIGDFYYELGWFRLLDLMIKVFKCLSVVNLQSWSYHIRCFQSVLDEFLINGL